MKLNYLTLLFNYNKEKVLGIFLAFTIILVCDVFLAISAFYYLLISIKKKKKKNFCTEYTLLMPSLCADVILRTNSFE